VHAVRPLSRVDEPLLVDGHPICAVCGAPAGTAAGRWRHVPATAPWPPRSVIPITWARLRRLDSYAAFAARFPWAVPAATPTTPADWAVGMDRLTRYHQLLRASASAADNPYLTMVRLLLGDPPRTPGRGLARLLDLPARRRELAARFAWAIPDEPALAALAALGPLVESGAGSGYWAALLSARGADVLAYDVAPPGGPVLNAHHPGRHTWTVVREGDAVTAVRTNRERALLMCWPPVDNDAAGYAALRAYRGDVLAYVGEGPDGATGTPRLHRELALNWTPQESTAIPTWPGLSDRLVIYRRNARRRAQTQRDRCDECRRYVATGSIGRCGRCRTRHPAALTLQIGPHRLEYSAEMLAAMHPALATALLHSTHRV
jgi:hypothetical protein